MEENQTGSAGINKLKIQMLNITATIPVILLLNNPSKAVPNFPLIPISAIAKEGMIARTQNKTERTQKLCQYPT